MSALPIELPPMPRQLDRFLKRLKIKLKQRELLRVLETLTAPSAIDFYETTLPGHSAARTFLGNRTQDDGSTAKSWAYVMLTYNVDELAVVFRDEVWQGDEQVQLYCRSATSLLRRAGKLLPPFRFLQFDSNDDTNHVRNMICALVLYYAAASGIADSATKWAKFETSLLEALHHIKNSADYQSWRAERDPTKIPESAGQHLDTVLGDDESPDKVLDDVSGTPTLKRGGVVQSIGRSMVAKPGTLFAKLKDALGKQVDFLDAIPTAAITIERQDAYPDYFPYRLRLGIYRDRNVYVYLAPELRSHVQILPGPDADNVARPWKFDELSNPQLQLNRPFDFIMGKDCQNLKSRAMKVRYFVYYYYMLAENQGLIDYPEIRTTAETMLPKFTSVCKDLRDAGHGVDETDSAGDPADEAPMKERLGVGSVHKQPLAVRESLILKLRVKPEVLRLYGGPKFPRTRPRINKSIGDQVINDPHVDDMQQDDVVSAQEPKDALATVPQETVVEEHEPVVDNEIPAYDSSSGETADSSSEQDVEMPEQNKIRAISRDSGLGPSRKSSAADVPGFSAAAPWQPTFSLRTRSPLHQPQVVLDDDSAVQDQDSGMDLDMSDAGEERVVEQEVVPLEGSEQEVVEEEAIEEELDEQEVVEQEVFEEYDQYVLEQEAIMSDAVGQEDILPEHAEQELAISGVVDQEIILPETVQQAEEPIQSESNRQEDDEQNLFEPERSHQDIVESDVDRQNVTDRAAVQQEVTAEHCLQQENVEHDLAVPNIANSPDVEMCEKLPGNEKGVAQVFQHKISLPEDIEDSIKELTKNIEKYTKQLKAFIQVDANDAEVEPNSPALPTEAVELEIVIVRDNIVGAKQGLASFEEAKKERHAARPNVDKNNDQSRQSSEQPLNSPAQAPAQSHIIDLCGDDDVEHDDMVADNPRSQVEGTPDFEEVQQPRHLIPGQDRRSLENVRGKKREFLYISSDDDDEIVNVQDGSAWKRASLGITQEDPVILDRRRMRRRVR